ncbi:hypothetical protein ACFYVR_25935 [Rhodococcus sp. NPDC003318]|uniref:hypothetical protein n=1 Tax=Rhodococcus sp. NPDC003318 TaxID=3364503 RepID=UPI0036C0137B
MTRRRTSDAAALRGGAVGALTAALAVAGHGLGGGGYPTSAALTLLVLCCGGVGALAGSPAARSGDGRVALVAALAGGQLAGHLVLSAAAIHPHTDSGVRGLSMLVAHGAATAVCAALILAAERLHGPITRVLRVVLRAPSPPPGRRAPHGVPDAPVTLRHLLLDHVLSRRGPPAALT